MCSVFFIWTIVPYPSIRSNQMAYRKPAVNCDREKPRHDQIFQQVSFRSLARIPTSPRIAS